MRVSVPAHGPPGIPRDLENDCRDRKADEGVGNRQAERDNGGGGNHGKADVGIGAGMVAVRDQRRAIKTVARSGSYLGGYLVD